MTKSVEWTEKAKLQLLNKHTKTPTAGEEIRKPAAEFARSMYWLEGEPVFDEENQTDEEIREIVRAALPNGKFGFPAVAFKACAVDSGYQQKILDKKTTARGAFHILADMIPIEGSVPTMREDVVKIGMGTACLRYRGEFREWSAILPIQYNSGAMSIAQIVNLFQMGGFANGIGEWRPQRDGSYGRFHVETIKG